MANLIETYTLTSDDGSESLTIEKDCNGNIKLRLKDDLGLESMLICEEFASQFTYVLNRLS